MEAERATEPELTADDLNRSQIVALAKAHVARFERLLASGYSNVRVGECENYLRIWREVERKADIRELTEEEANEVDDAIYCGDYDELLEASCGEK